MSWFKKSDRTLARGFVVVINGGSAVGKTTVAAMIARRWNVAAVIGTDVIREAFRQLPDYPPDTDVRALISRSSYLAHGGVKCEETSEFKAACLAAFAKQNNFLFGPISRVIRRLRNKREAVVLEGVNVTAMDILSIFPHPRLDKVLVANLYLSDKDGHEARIRERGEQTNEEPERTEAYLNNLIAIRYIDEYLKADAKQFIDSGAVISLDNDRSVKSTIATIEECLKRKV